MKFTKPISREVEIDGTDFILSFDDTGIDFRLKGKRKTAHVSWTQVLDVATADGGEAAREVFGVRAGAAANPEIATSPVHRAPEAPEPEPQADGDSMHSAITRLEQTEESHSANPSDETERHGFAASAGDPNLES